MTLPNEFLDLSKFTIAHKDPSIKELSPAHIQALGELAENQGDLSAVSPASRTLLSELQAKYATDPNIVGAAAAADFSLRVVSIHKTWGFFKNMRTTDGFDPRTLPRIDLRLSDIVKRP